jgi:predicted RNase H-like HicB family nuclease
MDNNVNQYNVEPTSEKKLHIEVIQQGHGYIARIEKGVCYTESGEQHSIISAIRTVLDSTKDESTFNDYAYVDNTSVSGYSEDTVEYKGSGIDNLKDLKKFRVDNVSYNDREIPIRVYKDGDDWCAIVGLNIQEGVASFGKTISEAVSRLAHKIAGYTVNQFMNMYSITIPYKPPALHYAAPTEKDPTYDEVYNENVKRGREIRKLNNGIRKLKKELECVKQQVLNATISIDIGIRNDMSIKNNI